MVTSKSTQTTAIKSSINRNGQLKVLTDPIESITSELINSLGEDPKREGLLKTPKRVAKAMRSLTADYE